MIESSWNLDQLLSGLKTILDSADAGWYRQLAESGYEILPYDNLRAHNWVLFPLFPLVLRFFLQVGIDPTLAGVLVSSLSFYLALVVLHSYLIALGKSFLLAKRSVWLVCFFPTSYFFLSPITESLFFLLLVGSFFSLHSSRVLLAGLLIALAGFCRPTGMMMIPAFALALYRRDELSAFSRIAALAIAPLGVLIFSSYLYWLTGNPLAFVENQSSWGRSEQSILELVVSLVFMRQSLILPWNFVVLNLAAVVLAIACSFNLARAKNWPFVAILLVPILAGLGTGTLQSLARHVLVLFPIYLILGEWSDNQENERIVLTLMAFLLAVMTLGFALKVTSAMA